MLPSRLFALSDLHLHHTTNWDAMLALPAHPADGLVLAGDVTESLGQLERLLDHLAPRWARLYWVPGNHDLWTVARHGETLRGVERYERLVEICRARSVRTPEDPFEVWPGVTASDGRSIAICPLFVGYDFSFGPEGMSREGIREWAEQGGNLATDDALLGVEPYANMADWCAARVVTTEARLTATAAMHRTVLINHWLPRREHVRLGRVERYAPWCGTTATRDWHRRFHAVVAVTGHIHVRSTDVVDGVRFEEVSLGYPRDWDAARGAASYLRRIV